MALTKRINVRWWWAMWIAAVAISPWLPEAVPSSTPLGAPGIRHLLGSTPSGTDLLWTVSLAILRAQAFAVLSASLACVSAIPIGLFGALRNGHWISNVFGTAAIILDAISPIVILSVVLAALPDTSPVGLAIVLGIVGWTFLVNPIRHLTRELLLSQPVFSLRAIGYSNRQIVSYYIMPELGWRLAPHVIALATIYIGTIGAVEFLGLGMRRQQSIGYLVLDSLARLDQSPRYFTVCLAACVLAVFILGTASTLLAAEGARRRGGI